MRFLVKFIRPLWAVPIGLIYAAIYGVRYLFDMRLRVRYTVNRTRWNCIRTLDDLIQYFKKHFSYQSDGPLGLVDHTNFPIEFFTTGGDCDDAAFYARKKLQEIGYSGAVVYFIYGNGPENWHFDCKLVTTAPFFFNYGEIILFDPAMYSKRYGWKNPARWVEL